MEGILGMPVVEAAGEVVARPATAPTTKETATTHQCPRNMLGRSRCMGASRNPPTARATSPTRASSNLTTRASTAATARHRASRKAMAMGRAATPPTPTLTTPLVVVGALTTATTANSTTVVVEAGVEGTAMAPAGHPTTQAHMGVMAQVLEAALHTKANKEATHHSQTTAPLGPARATAAPPAPTSPHRVATVGTQNTA